MTEDTAARLLGWPTRLVMRLASYDYFKADDSYEETGTLDGQAVTRFARWFQANSDSYEGIDDWLDAAVSDFLRELD